MVLLSILLFPGIVFTGILPVYICRKQTHCRFVLLLYCIFIKQVWVVCCIGGDDKVCSHLLSKTSSSSWAFLHSSSAGGKLLPTLVKSAAILLLRRKPAALRFNPWSTQASTAATHTYIYTQTKWTIGHKWTIFHEEERACYASAWKAFCVSEKQK